MVSLRLVLSVSTGQIMMIRTTSKGEKQNANKKVLDINIKSCLLYIMKTQLPENKPTQNIRFGPHCLAAVYKAEISESPSGLPAGLSSFGVQGVSVDVIYRIRCWDSLCAIFYGEI